MDELLLFGYWPWYACCAMWAGCGWWEIVLGGVPVGVAMIATAVAVAAFLGVLDARAWRAGTVPFRRELLALAASRHGEAALWHNRDAGVAFTVSRQRAVVPCWLVVRADEDLAGELEETGRVAATGDAFRIIPGNPQVRHHVVGGIITRGNDGEIRAGGLEPAGRPGRDRERLSRLTRASAADLRELVSQFRGAEPAARDDGTPL